MADEQESGWFDPGAPTEVLQGLLETMAEETLTQMAASTVALFLYRAGVPMNDQGEPVTEEALMASVAYHRNVYDVLSQIAAMPTRDPIPEVRLPDDAQG